MMRLPSLTPLLLLPLLAFAPGCASESEDDSAGSDSALSGGTLSSTPGLVALSDQPSPQVPSQRDKSCTGVLLADQWVMTTAWCAVGNHQHALPVQAMINRSALRWTGTGETIGIDQRIVHPQFVDSPKGPRLNNIALLHLATPAHGPKAKLMRSTDLAALSPNAEAQIAGYRDVSSIGFGDRASAAQRLLSPTDCAVAVTQMGSSASVPNTSVCASSPHDVSTTGVWSPNKGQPSSDVGGFQCASLGNEGSPLLMNLGGESVVVGLLDWTRQCDYYPGVYTVVGSYATWLSASSGGEIAFH